MRGVYYIVTICFFGLLQGAWAGDETDLSCGGITLQSAHSLVERALVQDLALSDRIRALESAIAQIKDQRGEENVGFSFVLSDPLRLTERFLVTGVPIELQETAAVALGFFSARHFFETLQKRERVLEVVRDIHSVEDLRTLHKKDLALLSMAHQYKFPAELAKIFIAEAGRIVRLRDVSMHSDVYFRAVTFPLENFLESTNAQIAELAEQALSRPENRFEKLVQLLPVFYFSSGLARERLSDLAFFHSVTREIERVMQSGGSLDDYEKNVLIQWTSAVFSEPEVPMVMRERVRKMRKKFLPKL